MKDRDGENKKVGDDAHLYVDLNWLPLSTLGVCHPFCVVLAGVDHRLRVFRLLLQGEGHPTHTHRPADRYTEQHIHQLTPLKIKVHMISIYINTSI